MTSDKARTERIQQVYGARTSAEVAERYDDWAAAYDADLEALGFSAPRAAAETLAKYVGAPDAKLLDAGAGTGLGGEELARLGYKRITALDLSPGMLMVANEKMVYEELVVAELGKPLPFESGAFAGTLCVGALTISHAPPESLEELARVTASGGCVVFTVRTDTSVEGGYEARQAALEREGKWRILERSEPFQPMPNGEPDIWYHVWVYQVG